MEKNNNPKQNLDPEIASLLNIPLSEVKQSYEKEKTDKKVKKGYFGSEFLHCVIEGEDAKIVNDLLHNKNHFDKDKVNKGLYREKLIASYWNLCRSIVPKIGNNLSEEKRLCLRYNLLDTDIISSTQCDMLFSILTEKDESIFYLDEWLSEVSSGNITESIIDETIIAMKKDGYGAKEKLIKKTGQRDAGVRLIKNCVDKIKLEEGRLSLLINGSYHNNSSYYINGEEEEFLDPYSKEQRATINTIVEGYKFISKMDKDLIGHLRDLKQLEEVVATLEDEVNSNVGLEDSNRAIYEFNTVKQMIKLSVGRLGNHFPILLRQYFTDEVSEVGTKQNIRKIILDMARLDEGLFIRTYKGEEYTIEPYFILVPCYGEFGICWDPIPKENRANGKGRIAIPIFPKNLKMAVIGGLADLRWQVAKFKGQHYWMEEGLTGRYYEYYQSEKLKGDVRRHFIRDYILWLLWESNGVQKLHKDVRSIFWRLIPFPLELRETLKDRGYYYNELYQKDKIRKK